MSIAQQIYAQLGGRAFSMMTGAKNFVDHGNGLGFRIGRNAGRANHILVTLTPADLYDVEFSASSVRGHNRVALVEGVFVDQLKPIISEQTGLALELPVIRRVA